MSLTKNDLKLISNILESKFANIEQRLDQRLNKQDNFIEQVLIKRALNSREEIKASEVNLKKVIQKMEERLKKELTIQLKQNVSIIQIQMNVEFKKIDSKLVHIASVTEETKENMMKMGDRLEDHEVRINLLEQTKLATVQNT